MERSRSFGSLLWKSQGGLPRHLKTRFCPDVADGLEALHLIEILTAKVSDFGFCIPDTTARDLTVGARGTVRVKTLETLYEVPRSLRQYANLSQRHLYSYGVMIWERVNDGYLPSHTVSDANVPILQLSADDGASYQK
ncbi:hypothetical protein ARMSODRAFT_1014249 [Armillaria solidipes]|uniref:Protein kinase domain-containing protein n=1 Tax=Armillaria solidipes TaxID=1076256 RepID=A0A2H3BWC4_9AGAR|nr:hypothetical protein ARMSODRAFT_1014249 [Armillaria solidipes]